MDGMRAVWPMMLVIGAICSVEGDTTTLSACAHASTLEQCKVRYGLPTCWTDRCHPHDLYTRTGSTRYYRPRGRMHCVMPPLCAHRPVGGHTGARARHVGRHVRISCVPYNVPERVVHTGHDSDSALLWQWTLVRVNQTGVCVRMRART